MFPVKILDFGAAMFSLLDRGHCLRKQVFLTALPSWEEDLGVQPPALSMGPQLLQPVGSRASGMQSSPVGETPR